MTTNDTRETIPTAAQATVQAKGYNALSFRELAKAVGIKSASIHYYFPTKGDLGAELARRYTDNAVGYFEKLIAGDGSIDEIFARYVAVFRAALQKRQPHVPVPGSWPPNTATCRSRCVWRSTPSARPMSPRLVRLLGPRHPELSDAALRARALAIFAAIEGAQLVARGRGDIAVFDQTMAAYRIAGLTP
ncbi:TetR/AcrR family transcriptional regulator [Caulobacter segnis]